MIKIKNLNINFKNDIIYNNFSLEVNKGDKVALVGKSGSGKSTMLNLLAGFITDFTGNIFIQKMLLSSDNIHKIREIIAWLPQETIIQTKTVNDLFITPFKFDINKYNTPNDSEIKDIFHHLELSKDILLKDTKNISGGERQRIMLASCLLLKKDIILLDEPTSALDNVTKNKITDYILSQKDITVIAATHDNYWINKSTKVITLPANNSNF